MLAVSYFTRLNNKSVQLKSYTLSTKQHIYHEPKPVRSRSNKFLMQNRFMILPIVQSDPFAAIIWNARFG